MRGLVAVGCALSLALAGGVARAQDGTFGCIEGPAVEGGRFDSFLLTRVTGLAPACVRVRFRLDLWRSVDDPAQRGPLDRRLVGEGGLFDELIREIRRAGAFVIVTVGVDAAGVTPAQLTDPTARARYADAVASLALRYRGKLRAIELEDQPNLRASGDAGAVDRIPAAVYASTLVAVQTRLRPIAEALRCEMPRVIVGGLVDAQEGELGSRVQQWLPALYEALAADPAAAQLRAWGREPVADLGVEVLAEADASVSSEWLAGGASGHLFELDSLYRTRLMGVPRPRVWITSGSYRAASPSMEDIRQTSEAIAYFNVPSRRDLPIRPEVITWSPLNEPASACTGRGLFLGCAANSTSLRDTFGAVGNGITSVRPTLWSRLEFTERSVRVAAGSTATVQLRVTNAGPQVASSVPWSAATDLYIAQPEGCPESTELNNIPWTDLPAGSVSSAGAVGARLRFIPATVMPPTTSRVVSWTIAPPRGLAPGPWTVAARMQQGTRWFGPEATIAVEVLPPEGVDAGAAAPDVVTVSDVLDGGVVAPGDVVREDRAAPLVVDVGRIDATTSGGQDGSGCAARRPGAGGRAAALLLAVIARIRRRRRIG